MSDSADDPNVSLFRTPQQLPPADELAAIRATFKTLGEREAALKALVINDPSARTGNQFCVDVVQVITQRCDIKELRAAYPAEVEEHTHPITTTRVELRGLTDDGEIVSLRRKVGK
jgi:hypothetical protein